MALAMGLDSKDLAMALDRRDLAMGQAMVQDSRALAMALEQDNKVKYIKLLDTIWHCLAFCTDWHCFTPFDQV